MVLGADHREAAGTRRHFDAELVGHFVVGIINDESVVAEPAVNLIHPAIIRATAAEGINEIIAGITGEDVLEVAADDMLEAGDGHAGGGTAHSVVGDIHDDARN
jgi:hypothetical protein